MTTLAPPRPTGRRRPVLDRDTAMRLAATEYDRFLAALRALPNNAWSMPTANTGWDVHAMACHVLGMAKMFTTVRESLRQSRSATTASKRTGELFIDELTGLQVREHVSLSPTEIVNRFADTGPAAARGRRRMPALLRHLGSLRNLPIAGPGSPIEDWTMGYLVDVILTRDTWMHRSDLALATGTPMTLTPDHDGVLIADVASEWASRHGQPCTLRLTGPAGGESTWGEGGPTIELDAVDFCRIISGRGTGADLLDTPVPF